MGFDIDDVFDLPPDEPVLVIQGYTPAQIQLATDASLTPDQRDELMEQYYQQNLQRDPDLQRFKTIINEYADKFALSSMLIDNRFAMMSGDQKSLEKVRDLLLPGYYSHLYSYETFLKLFGPLLQNYGVLNIDIELGQDDDDEPNAAPGPALH